MKPPPFTYVAPTTLDEALTTLAEHGDEATPLAGGQSLVPLLNLRLARPEVVVDLRLVDELRGSTVADEGLTAGATVTATELLEDPEVGRVPGVHEALRWIAHPQIRNRTTIGGSLAHADPAAELPALLAGLGGAVRLVSAARGERWVPADELFLGPFTTAREPDELLAAARLPRWPGTVTVTELARRPGDFAVAGAVVCSAPGRARVALFGVGGAPVVGTGADVPTAAEVAYAAMRPGDDVHGSAEYRRAVVRALVERAPS